MRRGLVVALCFSAALNIGLLAAVGMHGWEAHRGPRAFIGEIARGPGGRAERRHGRHRPLEAGAIEARFLARWPGRRIARLTRDLDLTLEQQTRLRESLTPLGRPLARSTEDLWRERLGFRRILGRMPLVPAEIQNRAARVARAQARLDSLTAEALSCEMAVLDSAQRARHDVAPTWVEPPDHDR